MRAIDVTLKLQNLPKQVSASEAVATGPTDRTHAGASPALYNREQPRNRSNVAADPRASEKEAGRRSGYIDIVYAGDRANGSIRRFGNFGLGSEEDRRMYGIEDIMKVSTSEGNVVAPVESVDGVMTGAGLFDSVAMLLKPTLRLKNEIKV